jgi:protein-glutamine gamma-glutamyltransferase
VRFSAIHKVASYLMALSAYGALVFSGELGVVTSVLGLLGIAASWFWEPPRVRPERWAFWWNALAVVALAYTIASVLAGESVVNGFARFLVFLLLAKLFSRVTSRDYLWAYVLSFSLLVAGTALNAGVSYALFFLGYVVFATWAFILFHLRREMEENFLLKHSDDSSSEKVEVERILNSRRIVGPAFLAGTSMVSLAIFVAATLLFFLFPRIGFGLFFEKSRSGIPMAGFSDGVTLGGHGRIRNDDTVVMRVVVDDPEHRGRGAPPLHWRGVAFDRYSEGRWYRSAQAPATGFTRTAYEKTSRVKLTLDFPSPEGKVLKQEVYLEPLDSAVLFGASMPLMYDLPNQLFGFRSRTAEIGKNGEVRLSHSAGLRYVVFSDPVSPPPSQLAAIPDADSAAMSLYLTLPPELPPRVRELAQRITAGQRGPWAKAQAVQRFLSGYAYTLEQDTDDTREPLDYFLFERKQGHCEYFSSAMAVLLRAAGVPTRNVNGFVGGEWNEYGGYIAVRSGDAHSWVEVWFDGVGWVTFDPTPPAGSASRTSTSFLDKMRRFLDTLRLEYFKWVIEYDLSRQVGLMRKIGGAVRTGKDKLQGGLAAAWRFFWTHAEELAFVGGVVLCGFAVTWWRRRKRRVTAARRRGRVTSRSSHPVVAVWARTAARLARRGWVRGAAQTPREFAAGLAAREVPGARPFSTLTEIYYAARFGETAALARPVDLDEARQLAEAVTRELKAPKRAA